MKSKSKTRRSLSSTSLSTTNRVSASSSSLEPPQNFDQIQAQLRRLRDGEPLVWMQKLSAQSPPIKPANRIDLIIQFPSKKEYKLSKQNQLCRKQFSSVGLQWRKNPQRLQFLLTIPDELMFFLAEKLALRMKLKVEDKAWKEYLKLSNLDGIVPNRFWAKVKRSDLEYYDFESQEHPFTTTQRALVIYFILVNINFRIGLDFGQHGLALKTTFQKTKIARTFDLFVPDDDPCNGNHIRSKLRREWASFWRIFRSQPLDDIKAYYGAEVAIYFAWLGFLNQSFVYAILILLPILIYNFITFFGLSGAKMSEEICSQVYDDYYRCPICRFKTCNFTFFSADCHHYRWMDFHVNHMAAAYAFVMSVWAVCLYHRWRRYARLLTHHWERTFDEDDDELDVAIPYVSFLEKTKQLCWKTREHLASLSFSTFTVYVLPTFFGLVIMFIIVSIVDLYIKHCEINPKMNLFEKFTVNRITAFVIYFAMRLFNPLARGLSLRLAIIEGSYSSDGNQKRFHACVVQIISLLTFFSSFSYLLFITFGKGMLNLNYLIDPELEVVWKPKDIFATRCFEDDCLYELSTDIASLLPMECITFLIWYGAFPYLKSIIQKNKVECCRKESGDQVEESLEPIGLDEYYLQAFVILSFTTFFIFVLPYSSMIFLAYGVLRLRIDAVMLVLRQKRCPPTIATDLGPWGEIFRWQCYLVVIWNALLVSFVGDIVPKLEYIVMNRHLAGYFNTTLTFRRLTDFSRNWYPIGKYCRYRGYYRPSWEGNEAYNRNNMYYYFLKIRIIVFIVYIVGVFSLSRLLLRIQDNHQRYRFIAVMKIYDRLCQLYSNGGR